MILLHLMLAGSFMLAYLPVWRELLSAWSSSDDYSHGFFIVPIIGYILWRNKAELANVPRRTSRVGFVLFLGSLLVYIFAYYGEIRTLASFSLVTTLAGCVLFLYGPAMLKKLSFPLFFLLFMIPVPTQVYSSMTIPLQLIVSKASVWLVSIMGIPVLRDGNVIHLPGHTFEVVRACSGLRSLITLLTLSTVVAYFTLNSNFLRVLLAVFALPAAIAVNMIRVTLMIITYYFWNYDLTEGPTHSAFGLVVFILAIVLILMLKGVLNHWDSPGR